MPLNLGGLNLGVSHPLPPPHIHTTYTHRVGWGWRPLENATTLEEENPTLEASVSTTSTTRMGQVRPDPSLLLLPSPAVSPQPLASPSGAEQGGAQARLRPRVSPEHGCPRTGLLLPGLELLLEASGPWAAASGPAGGVETHHQGCYSSQPSLSTQSLHPRHPRLQATLPGGPFSSILGPPQGSFLVLCTAKKAMAPHSSTLAWKIPRTEEPGRLQSMGSRRVGHSPKVGIWSGHSRWLFSCSLFFPCSTCPFF